MQGPGIGHIAGGDSHRNHNMALTSSRITPCRSIPSHKQTVGRSRGNGTPGSLIHPNSISIQTGRGDSRGNLDTSSSGINGLLIRGIRPSQLSRYSHIRGTRPSQPSRYSHIPGTRTSRYSLMAMDMTRIPA